MIIKIGLSKYRILMLAIAISFLWHMFWLFAIKIVDRPSQIETVKFSQVSFLGPILGGRGFGLRIKPQDRSFLEKKYFNSIGNIANASQVRMPPAQLRYDADKSSFRPNDRMISSYVRQSLESQKIEPDNSGD